VPDPGSARAAVVVTAVDVLPDGRPAGFWLPEEEATAVLNLAPVLLPDALGALIAVGPPLRSRVVVDGRLVTGQNAASAPGAARALAHALGPAPVGVR
jgi:putative intracellular protease/amidase